MDTITGPATIVATVTAKPSRSKGHGWATIDGEPVRDRVGGHTIAISGRLAIVAVGAQLRRASGRRDIAMEHIAVSPAPGATVIVRAGSPQRYEVTLAGAREWDVALDGMPPSHTEALALLSDPAREGVVRLDFSGDTYPLRTRLMAVGATWQSGAKAWRLIASVDDVPHVVRLIEELPPTVDIDRV